MLTKQLSNTCSYQRAKDPYLFTGLNTKGLAASANPFSPPPEKKIKEGGAEALRGDKVKKGQLLYFN